MTAQEALFDQRVGRVRAVVMGPDGSLYFSVTNRDGRGYVRAGDDRIFPKGMQVGRVTVARAGNPFQEIMLDPIGLAWQQLRERAADGAVPQQPDSEHAVTPRHHGRPDPLSSPLPRG